MSMPRLAPHSDHYTSVGENPHTYVIACLNEAGFNLNYDQQYDDGGKPIDAIAQITVGDAEELSRAVKILHASGYGATPKGEATSANSSMKDGGSADLAGIRGRFSIALKPGKVTYLSLPSSRYEATEVDGGKAQIMRARTSGVANRVLADAGALTPLQLDHELGATLGKGHGTGLTHTTRGQTRLAGPLATSAQGPERFDASLNVQQLVVVDGTGEIRILKGDDAAMQIGLNGAAGTIREADLEVQRELPYEFGVFVPLPGSLQDGMTKHIPAVLARLAQYSLSQLQSSGDGGAPVIASKNGPLLLKGFDVVTRHGMGKGHALMEGGAAKGKAGAMLQNMRENNCEVGLMINGRSSLKPEEINNLFTGLFDEKDDEDKMKKRRSREGLVGAINGLMDEDHIHGEPLNTMVFDAKVMQQFRDIRELVAVAARKSKEVGPSKSTDFNVKIDPNQSPEDLLKAMQAVMEVGYSYISEGLARDADGYAYGHAFIGALMERIIECFGERFGRRGGGVDLHLRLTFPIQTIAKPGQPPQSIPDQQARAAENVDWLDGKQAEYALKLLALHGKFGITVEPGEKGLLFSAEYIRWLEENDPGQAEATWKYIQQMGGDVFGSRLGNLKFHAYPPRIKEGVLNYFAAEDIPGTEHDKRRKSIALWTQESHRSADGQLVYGEMLGLMRQWLKLGFNDRVFISSSKEKSILSCQLALTDYKGGKTSVDLRNNAFPEDLSMVDSVIIAGVEQADDPRLVGIKKILAVDGDEHISPEDYRKVDAVVYAAEGLGASGQMGIEVMPLKTVQCERELKARGNQTGYVHSPDARNDLPHSMIETPPLETIADTAIELALKLNQRGIEEAGSAAQRLNIQRNFITVNPGPSKNHPATWERAVELAHQEAELLKNPDALREKVEQVRGLLREYLNIPDSHEIFFAGSATEAMELTYSSLNLDRAVVLTAGPFGNRQLKVAHKFAKPKSTVVPVLKRWGTGVNSDPSIVGELQAQLQAQAHGRRTALGSTGNETGCGVWNDTDKLVTEVNGGVYSIVDGTSEMLGVPHDWSLHDVYLGSFQKFGGVPSGLSAMIVKKRAVNDCRETLQRRAQKPNLAPLYRTFDKMDEDPLAAAHNVRGLLQLECVLNDFIARGGMPALRAQADEKLAMLDAMIAQNPHLDHAVVAGEDRSKVMRHLVCIDRSADDIERRMKPVIIGAGYGTPYKGDTLRVYATPHLDNGTFKSEVVDRLDQVSRHALAADRNRPVVARFVADLKLPA